MIQIFTPLKSGQILMPEVIRGIGGQDVDCGLIPITSDSSLDHSESNKRVNVLKALDLNKEDYFILMDSDVAMLNGRIIREMMDDKLNKGRKIVAVTTKLEKIEQCRYVPHSLMLLRGDMIQRFKEFCLNYQLTGEAKKDCFVCRFVIQNLKECISIQCDSVYEVPRQDLSIKKEVVNA
jgi:hypothetical protein